MSVLCPVSGKPGKRVRPVTLESLVSKDHLPELEDKDWFFCDLADCNVVYFSSDEDTIPSEALTVRVGVKADSAPHPVCYCFGHTTESIREEIENTGTSTVVESITAKVKAGECACETKNPKGSCCLGDVGRAVKATFEAAPLAPPPSGSEPEVSSCNDLCAKEDPK